ncbi:MAG TPA: hypothetical protein EYP98_01785 [Planctomycetes bacterium]|nr:hypothetical protein [Planctomycetota bacterium]
MTRNAHLLGSVGLQDAKAVFTTVADTLGESCPRIPDGEPGDRGYWIRWQQKTDEPLVGGTLATAGGLVFTGEGSGNFSAFDAASGKRLWHFYCGAGVNAPPISYKVGERQFIAVAAGGSKIWGYPQGDAVIAFALTE